jgi:proteasome component ECM29
VKYSNAIFPFSYPLARYISLVASADSKLEVREEGKRGLVFPEAPLDSNEPSFETYRSKLPHIGDLSAFLKKMEKKPRLSARAPGVKYVGSLTAEMYSISLEFLRRLIVAHADPKARLDELTMGTGDDEASKITEPSTRQSVRALISSLWTQGNEMQVEGENNESSGAIKGYLYLIETALKSDEVDAVLQSVASTCLLELMSFGPSSLAESYRDKVDWIRGFLSSLKSETRVCMARILGIVSTSELNIADRSSHLSQLIEELMKSAVDMSKQVGYMY